MMHSEEIGRVTDVKLVKPAIYNFEFDREIPTPRSSPHFWGWCRLGDVIRAVNDHLLIGEKSYLVGNIEETCRFFTNFIWLNFDEITNGQPEPSIMVVEDRNLRRVSGRRIIFSEERTFVPAGWVTQILDVVRFGIRTVDIKARETKLVLTGQNKPLFQITKIGTKADGSKFQILHPVHGANRFLPVQETKI